MWQHIEKSEKGHWNPEGGNIGPNVGPRHFAEQFSIFGRFVAERLGDFKRKNWRFNLFKCFFDKVNCEPRLASI